MHPSRLSCAAAMSAVVLAFAVPALAQETSPQNNAEMAAIFAADPAGRPTADELLNHPLFRCTFGRMPPCDRDPNINSILDLLIQFNQVYSD